MSRTQFTVEQANSTLPLVRRIVEDIVLSYRRWQNRVAELEIANLERTPDHPSPRAEELEGEILRIAAEIEGYARELRQLGIELKDHGTGLIDFPAEVDGRLVYLCWRLGEPSVRFFHERDAGVAGRRPIPGQAA